MRGAPIRRATLSAVIVLSGLIANPVSAIDSDGDGMLDAFELANAFDPNDPDEDMNGRVDGQDDEDADGLGNAAEQGAVTDPRDADTDDDGLIDGDEIGTGSFPAHQLIASPGGFPLFVHPADLDGDGDLDLLTGFSQGDRLVWFENTNGEGSYGPERVINAQAGAVGHAVAADVDGDGDLDVIYTAGVFTPAWHENLDGQGSFGPRQTIALFDNPVGVAAADFDGDGDIDVLTAVAPSLAVGPFQRIAWFENMDGLGTFGPERVISVGPQTAGDVVAADLDGDGDMDLLCACRNLDRIAWYENTDAAGTFGAIREISPLVDTPTSVFPADIDGDGDLDVLSSSFFDDKLAWYENTNGAGTFGPQQVLTDSADGAHAVVGVDLDGDGDTDALSASGFDDIVAWYENLDGSGSFGTRRAISTATGSPLSVAAGDADGDGDEDVFTARLVTFEVGLLRHANVADPRDPDSDDDGFDDGAEVAAGTNPLNASDFPVPVPALPVYAVGVLGLLVYAAASCARAKRSQTA